MREFVAGPDDAGARFDVVVARLLGVSRAVAARLVDAGDATLNGEVAARSARIEEGARISVADAAPDAPPEHEDIDVPVVYSDEHIAVISKPAGLVVHPAPGHTGGTVVNALLSRLGLAGGAADRPGIVHRLDAGTSGLMVVARTEESYERLVEQMQAREVSRTYLTLVEGRPDTDTMTIDAPIGRSTQHRKKMAVVAGGKDAVTEATVLERHVRTSLVEARPVTGRTHQIRVHLSTAGFPVVGDPVYGKSRALARELGLDRPFLHAARLRFAHPITGAPVDIEDPLPADLRAALDRARTERSSSPS